MKILRTRDSFLLLVLALSAMISYGSDDNGMDCPDPTNADCDQIGDDPQDDDPVVLEPTLLSVAPVTGPKHTEVVITGKNFGTDPDKVSVSFNGTPGEVLGVTDTEVTVRVPARAHTGPITMEVDGFDLTGPEFVYELTYTVETFAGTPGEPGFLDGKGTAAKFNQPWDLVKDSGGNIFVVDRNNHAIRKITPQGVVSTFMKEGGEDGGEQKRFDYPQGLAIDGDDNIYVADSGIDRIIMIDPDRVWTNIAGAGQEGYKDGTGTNAEFKNPAAILVGEDAGGSALYVSEDNHAIRRISLDDGQYTVSTYAGPAPEITEREGYVDGGLSEARFSFPSGMAKSGEGTILIADLANSRIRAIDQDAGTVGTFAGGEEGGYVNDVHRLDARFYGPSDVSVAGDGTVYVADADNSCIRRIDSEGHVTTIGIYDSFDYNDGPGAEAKFNYPMGVLHGEEGEIYVADTDNNVIRKIIID
ncbi:IPT/TIG domain-containing protein [Flagellimonas algicola]|nr:IPT/TIG domain-containing protein [Allomuricauda algicola]